MGSSFIISFRCAGLMFDQPEISSIVLKQPAHIFACGCTMQILTHGESISFLFQIYSVMLAFIVQTYYATSYPRLLEGYKMLRHDQLLQSDVFWLYPPQAMLSLRLQLIIFHPKMLSGNLGICLYFWRTLG